MHPPSPSFELILVIPAAIDESLLPACVSLLSLVFLGVWGRIFPYFNEMAVDASSFDAAPNNLSIDSTLCAQLHLLLWAACLSFALGKQNKKGVRLIPSRKKKKKIFRGNFSLFDFRLSSLTYRSKLLHLYSDCVCDDDY